MLDEIFPIWLQSFLFTERQREVGVLLYVGDVPCVRYDFEWQGQKVLSDNFFVRGRDPHTVVPLIQSSNPAPDHILRVVEDQPDLQAAYENLGYRVDFVETLMARPLTNLPPLDERYEVMLVRGRGSHLQHPTRHPRGPSSLPTPRLPRHRYHHQLYPDPITKSYAILPTTK